MPVQQGSLESVNTGTDFENINSEEFSVANRILHNGTDLIKGEFQTIRPDLGFRFTTVSGVGPSFNNAVQTPEYIDNDTSTGAGGVTGYHLAVQYPTTIKTQQIKVFSTLLIGNVNNGDAYVEVFKDFGTVADQASLINVPVSSSNFVFRNDLSPQQFEFTIDLSDEQEGRSWFITFKNSSDNSEIEIGGITEIIVKDVPHPQIAYFRVDGTEASRYSMEESDILDLTYEHLSGKYYTIRFNDTGVGGANIGPDDDFTEVAGETSFNPIRWTEDPLESSFIRSVVNDRLVFATSAGTGRLSSNYVTSGNYAANLDYGINTLTSSGSFFGIQAVDSDTSRLKYGVGVTAGTFYKAAIRNFANNTTSADLVDLQPDLNTVYSGVENWTVTFISSSGHWTVNGNQTGSRPPAETGELYSTSGISFQISANETQNNNDSFTFSVDYEEVSRAVTSGTLNFSKSSDNYSSTITGSWTEQVTADDDKIEIFGITDAAINLFADDFTLTPSGAAVFPSIPVFTVEEVDDEGQIQQSIVDKLNVINDPTKSYNDYINGGVQLAISPTRMFVKVLNDIYTFSPSSPIPGLVDENTAGVSRSQDVIEPDEVYSLSYNETEGGFLAYIYFDDSTDELQVKTLTATSTPTPQARKVFLDVPDWEEQADLGKPYQFYWLADDNDTLFYIRRHGLGLVNTVKVVGSAGEANGTTLFVDTSKNFTTAGVKAGDLIIIDESGYADNGTYTITQVATSTSLFVNATLDTKTGINYEIASEAELLSFNTDSDQSAFAAVNVDDFTLRAGVSPPDSSTVTAEVINAWGEPLDGKTVNFSVTTGDGAVSPPSDTTDVNGEATTTFLAGTTPGAVTIKASITEV